MARYFENEQDTLEFRAFVERQIKLCLSPKFRCDEAQLLMNVFGNTFGMMLVMSISNNLDAGELERGVRLFNEVMEANSQDPINMEYVQDKIAILKDPSHRQLA